MIGTMMHDDALRFVQLGTFLERADNTASPLRAKQNLLRSSTSEEGSALDYYQWGGRAARRQRVSRLSPDLRRRHHADPRRRTPGAEARDAALAALLHGSSVVRLLDELAGGRVLDSRRVAGELRFAPALWPHRGYRPARPPTISRRFMDRRLVLRRRHLA